MYVFPAAALRGGEPLAESPGFQLSSWSCCWIAQYDPYVMLVVVIHLIRLVVFLIHVFGLVLCDQCAWPLC